MINISNQVKGPMPTYWLEGYKLKSKHTDNRVNYDEITNL